MEKISAYILTKNSDKYLAEIMESLSDISDEILIVDSGSTDKTQSITNNYKKAKLIFNEFKTFKEQRIFAADACAHDMVLFLDSDEIPDDCFVKSIIDLKRHGFNHDAYKIGRKWNVLGKDVHCIYPVTSPDYPIRLYRKSKVSFSDSNLIHESPSGYKTIGLIKGYINHITFHTKKELNQKSELYTDIAALDIIIKNKKINIFKFIFSPIGAFIKWYFIKQGYKDGYVGLILGSYAYNYTLKKYIKANTLKNGSSPGWAE